jgi:hypothetical protein
MGVGMKTKDGAIIVQTTSGAPLQGMEDIRNRYWVTVLAKVPIKQQNQMYEDALLNTRGYDPTKDAPLYIGYEVQRAEITDKGQGPWQSLGQVTAERVATVMNTWPIQTPELVNPQYTHPLLTFPLPPMIMRPWGDDITHSDLPLQSPEEIMEEMQAEAMAAEADAEPAEGEDEASAFSKAVERRRALAGRTNPMRNPGGGMYGQMGLEMSGGILPSQGYVARDRGCPPDRRDDSRAQATPCALSGADHSSPGWRESFPMPRTPESESPMARYGCARHTIVIACSTPS